MLTSLEFILLMLIATVVAVSIFRRLHLPTTLAYLAVGSLIGPHALSIMQDPEQWAPLAEFGVVFLMFSIGLEFSLQRLIAMRRWVLGLGSVQVSGTIALVMAINFLLPLTLRLPLSAAFAIGAALAMSSTAVVIKLLKENNELDTEHGKKIFGILLAQDLIVVPLLIIVALSHLPSNEWWGALAWALFKMVVTIVVLFIGGRWLLPRWLAMVARRHSTELFMLNLFLLTLGAAWLTHSVGISFALGAFIAGMLIAETDFRHQVEEDIQPFRDVLLGLFFITMGALLNWQTVLSNLLWVILFVVGLIVFKAGLITSLTYYFSGKRGVGSALRTGLALAQAGEFSFVLLHSANQYLNQNSLLHNTWLQVMLAGMVFSLMLTPLIARYAERIVARFSATEWLQQSLRLTRLASDNLHKDRVIVIGYGQCGQYLAQSLIDQQLPYHVLDSDVDIVSAAYTQKIHISYGDGTRKESLRLAGVQHARAVIVTFRHTDNVLKVTRAIRELTLTVPVIVRTVDSQPMTALLIAGATEVVPDTIESSLTLASHTLIHLGYPIRQVVRFVQAGRDQHYARHQKHESPAADHDNNNPSS